MMMAVLSNTLCERTKCRQNLPILFVQNEPRKATELRPKQKPTQTDTRKSLLRTKNGMFAFAGDGLRLTGAV